MADSKKYNGSTWEHSLRKLTTSTDTITTLPAVLYPTGSTATVGLKGNTVQNGTPTPDSPIMPQGTGERTGNLFDKSKRTDNSRVVYTTGEIGDLYRVFVSDFTPIEPNTTYTLNIVSSISDKTGHLFALYDENKNFVNTGAHEAISATTVYTFTTPSNVAYIRFNGNMASVDEIMLNTGSTALPYEPYGYKIPISSASTTTSVYLGEVETTRRIKKLVFDGTEEWQNYGQVPNTYRISISNSQSIGNPAMCSHFVNSSISEITSGKFTVGSTWIYFRYADVADLADFKTYLQQQYSAGAPVTVWYALAEPETGIVNEPLRKIGDYADTVSGITIPTITGADSFDVETTLKPSEVSLSYTGWHDATVKECDGSQWN